MSIYQSPLVDLVAIIATGTGVTLTVNDVQFGKPSIPAQGESTKNTKIPVSATPTSIYRGWTRVYYDRLNLADISHYGLYGNVAPPGTRITDCFDTIRKATGITFTLGDVEDTPIVFNGDGTASVLLKALPDSIGWIGEFNFPLRAKPLLSTAFSNNCIQWS